LAYVAGATKQISLGTSVIDMFFQNPVQLSKRFAALDILSDGRAIAGLGMGWSKDEYDVAGIPFRDRGIRADEYLQILKKIWTDDVVEFKGRFYNIPASKIGPKPVQKPHPLVLIGSFSPKTFPRIVNYANGWIGAAGFGPLEQLEQAINSLKEIARKADKDPSKVGIYMVIMAGLFLAGLAYLQYQQIASVNWDRIEGTISTIANATTNTFNDLCQQVLQLAL
jgi:alkanesulfonate monooxygenase SsuD/methylene tetrahydromethanopterin reductase-like flavin-dependent oxidoreductase (luciferase family)